MRYQTSSVHVKESRTGTRIRHNNQYNLHCLRAKAAALRFTFYNPWRTCDSLTVASVVKRLPALSMATSQKREGQIFTFDVRTRID